MEEEATQDRLAKWLAGSYIPMHACGLYAASIMPSRPNLTYFGTVPEAFVKLADVLLVVEGSSFPAHSQYMAAHSNIMQQLLTDTQHRISAAVPLRLEAEMARYTKTDVTAFLTHACGPRSDAACYRYH